MERRPRRALERLVDAYHVPTQSCCLAHVTTQLAALERGAPVDLLFQSIAGTQAANAAFGVSLNLLKEGREEVVESHRRRDVHWAGPQVMYFETGQGSALSADAHHGVDQLTLEARAYAVAREFAPLLVNTVVGFIGPEYLYDARQITRAGLEIWSSRMRSMTWDSELVRAGQPVAGRPRRPVDPGCTPRARNRARTAAERWRASRPS